MPQHYEWWGGTNPLSGSFALADAIVAVSPNYANEILTPEFGCGVDGPLGYRRDVLTGILNGIDTEVWDPTTDPHIVSRFDADHLEAKAPNRAALLERLGFAGSDLPLAVAVDAPDRSEGDRPAAAPRVVARADPDAGRGARLG